MRDVATLIAGQTVLQIAGGLLNVWLPLAMSGMEFTPGEIGFVAAAYGLGFMAGAWLAPLGLRRVGAIRLYAASAAIACAATLSLHALDQSWGWAASRLIAGAAVAAMFAAAEGWLASAIPSERRGDVTGFYMLCTKLGLASGPFLIGFAHPAPEAAGPVMAAAAFFALSLVPIALADTTPPPPPSVRRMTPARLYRTAPAAFVAALGAGLVNGSVLSLAPLYAADRGGAAAAAGFQAAAWVGSLLVQWHAGKWSDRIDRRIVLAVLIGIPALAALALALAGEAMSVTLATVIFGVWGAGALSYYGIAVAHLGDRAHKADLPAAAAGLLFVWAAGSVVGPATGGLLVEMAGTPLAIFWQAVAVSALVVPWVLWRRVRRPSPPRESKVGFGPVPTPSVQGPELAIRPRRDDAPQEDPAPSGAPPERGLDSPP